MPALMPTASPMCACTRSLVPGRRLPGARPCAGPRQEGQQAAARQQRQRQRAATQGAGWARRGGTRHALGLGAAMQPGKQGCAWTVEAGAHLTSTLEAEAHLNRGGRGTPKLSWAAPWCWCLSWLQGKLPAPCHPLTASLASQTLRTCAAVQRAHPSPYPCPTTDPPITLPLPNHRPTHHPTLAQPPTHLPPRPCSPTATPTCSWTLCRMLPRAALPSTSGSRPCASECSMVLWQGRAGMSGRRGGWCKKQIMPCLA